MRKLLIQWLPVIIWASLIYTLSSFPTGTASNISWADYILKKTAHMVEYGVLALLTYRGLKKYKMSEEDLGFWSVVAVIFYAISDEYHQSFIPGRTSRPYDVLFDTIGAIIAIYLLWSIQPKLTKKHKKWAKKLGLV